MQTDAAQILPTSAAAVKPSEREALFSNYREFCKEEGLNGDCYPIKPHALKAFASAIGIGRKSRRARKMRRILKDILAGSARRHAAVRPKTGPPKGPPDQWGQREYHSLEACRRGGIKSGAVRRRNVQRRNTSIREMVFKHGHTRQQAATHHSISLRTVYYVLKQTAFHRGPKHVPTHGFREPATNTLRQAAQCAACHAPAPEPRVPVYARSTLALKLFWLRIAQTRLDSTTDRRRRSMHQRTVDQLNREINQYTAAIARHDPDRARLARQASAAWLDELTQSVPDPLLVLVRHQQYTITRQKARQHTPTRRKPTLKEPRT